MSRQTTAQIKEQLYIKTIRALRSRIELLAKENQALRAEIDLCPRATYHSQMKRAQ